MLKKKQKKIIINRIKFLIEKAIETYSLNEDLAKRYVYISWQYKKKYRVKLPKDLKRKFCKKCFTPWIPGKTLRVRINDGWVTYTCLNCGRIYKIRKKNEKK